MKNKLLIGAIAIIAVILLFFHFRTPSEPVNNTFSNIQLDGELNALLHPMPTNKTYKGTIATGHFKGTATVKNITGKFDISISNAYFDGILDGQVNNNSLFKGKAKGTISGKIQGTYKIKKERNYFIPAVILMAFLLPSIILLIYLKYKKEPDINYDEKENIAREWLQLNKSKEIYLHNAVTYPKNIITFFFITRNKSKCYSVEVTNNNSIRDPATYDNIYKMEEKCNKLNNLKWMITNENYKIKKKRRGF